VLIDSRVPASRAVKPILVASITVSMGILLYVQLGDTSSHERSQPHDVPKGYCGLQAIQRTTITAVG
jgi:hypothetical protein